MPFIGKLPDVGAFRLIDSITTSATDTYALQVEGLSYFPSSARNLIVSLNGVTQAPESAYTVSGSNIIFDSALTASDVIDYILVIGESVDIGTPSDNTVGNAQLKSNLDFSGKTLTFSADQISGDAINGGTISSFASTGIDDNATSTKLTVSDTGIDVTGQIKATSDFIAADSGGTARGYLFGTSSGLFARFNTGSNFQVQESGVTKLTVDSTGIDVTGNADVDGTVNSRGLQAKGSPSLSFNASNWMTQQETGVARTYICGPDASTYQPWEIYRATSTGGASLTMKLDASGNVLVGKTSTAFGTAGVEASASNGVWSTRSSLPPLALNRLSTDGSIVDFYKDGTTVGSIGTGGGQVYLDGASGDIGLYMGTNNLYPRKSGAITDNAVDLGQSSYRFRNLYMAGDAVMGASNNIIYQSGTTFNVRAAVADLTFQTNGANERMRIDSSGLVGINTENPSTFLEVAHATTGVANNITTYNSNTAASAECAVDWALNRTGSEAKIRAARITAGKEQTWTTTASTVDGYLKFLTVRDESLNEAMRIDSSGQLLFNCTTNSQTSDEGVKLVGGGRTFYVSGYNANNQENLSMYSTGASAYRFYVGWGGTVYATNTSISAISDQRFKENIRDLDAGLTEVLALKPRKFDWKEGKGANTKDARGFIAQEFEQVFPDLIDEWKDPAPEGEEPYKSVRQDLIPVLVKAIQEQQAMIEELKAEVAALKGE